MGVREEERRKELNDIRDQMETAQGRRVIWRLLEAGKVFSTTFNAEALSMAFLEGHRNIALSFLADVMDVAPKKFNVMMLEAKERREIVKALLEKEREAENVD